MAKAGKNDPVRRQYEALPYPARDPAAEADRLIVGSPSHLKEIEHYVLGGGRAGALKALIAGGGTGDGAIMLARQLAERGDGGQVLYIDLSAASLDIARRRAQARGLDNMRFEQASLLDITDIDPGPFDYVDCCGVLHHLEDPAAGLRALAAVLADRGGIGLMLYAPYGRTGVYQMQAALARLVPAAEPIARRLAGARKLLAGLPENNWLKRNAFLNDHLSGGDAGFYDLLLHSRDRAFTVAEIGDLAGQAGLRPSAFIEAAKYDPRLYLDDKSLEKRAQALPWLEQCALAEELSGAMKVHVCYLVKAASGIGAPAKPWAPADVPVLRELEADGFADAVAREPVLTATFDGVKYRRKLPKSAAQMLRLMDGRNSLGDIQRLLNAAPEVFRRDFNALYEALNPLNLLLFAGRRSD